MLASNVIKGMLATRMKKSCSWPEILLVIGQRCSVIVLRARFSIACPENQTGNLSSTVFEQSPWNF